MSFKVEIEQIVQRFGSLYRPAPTKPSPFSILADETIARICYFLTRQDQGNFEKACKRFYSIMSLPSSGIHTPLRLTCRELALNLTNQIEKVRQAVINRPLSSNESRQLGLPPLMSSFDSLESEVGGPLKTKNVLDQLFKDFKKYMAKMNKDRAGELDMNANAAMVKLITGSQPNPIAKVKAERAAQDFQQIVFEDLINSYAKRQTFFSNPFTPYEKITKESYEAKVDQIQKFFGQLPRSYIESQLKKALVQEHGQAILSKIQ